jgi:hypothetical protein
MYGIVSADAPDPPEELKGLDGSPVDVVRVGDLAAIVSDVSQEGYSDDALNSRLDDLAWVGERGLAHESVLDWFSERTPTIPLSLFSLHASRERLQTRIAAESFDFLQILERLRGKKEWGIKLWRKETEAREGIDSLSPSLQELASQIEAAPEGRRFLLERKRESMRVEELRAVSNRIAHDVFAALRDHADAGATVPLPNTSSSLDRVPLLHAAFLVSDASFASFQQAVTDEAGRLAGSGFELEFTGPWPPYHFSSLDDD